MLPVFITNNHIINRETLYKNNQEISFKVKEFQYSINMNLNNRIKYTNEEYDITIIEIKDTDNIDNLLILDDKIIDAIINDNNNNCDYTDKTIYIIQYPKGNLSVSYGILDNIYKDKKYNFNHKCFTEGGSSGSPILNLNNKIIGIHKEGTYNKYNMGTFLNYPIKEFIKLNYDKNKIITKSVNKKQNEILKTFNNKYNFKFKDPKITILDL